MVKVRKDLTGMKFGRLTVKKQVEDYVTPKGLHNAQWECTCDCGTPDLIIVRGTSLRSGKTKSCGCLRVEISREWGKKNGAKYRGNSKKYFGCTMCGSDKHYAKGYCRRCYYRNRRLGQKYSKERKEIKYGRQTFRDDVRTSTLG